MSNVPQSPTIKNNIPSITHNTINICCAANPFYIKLNRHLYSNI